MAPQLEIIQGTLDLLILNTLARHSNHGYGISRSIRARTEQLLRVQDAALYQALRRMEKKQLVSANWGITDTGRRARFYSLTEQGKRQLAIESSNWRLYAHAVFQVLEPGKVAT